MATPVKDPLTGAETTGHVWDETLQEFNNPLPRWWLWTFYATFAFAIIYWSTYPSWPIGGSYLKGFSHITYKTDAGEEKTTHWNMRALLAKDMQTGEQALKQKAYLDKVSAASYEQIAQDPDMSAFVRSYGNGIFGDKCAACHQAGGQGVPGLFPTLVDDDWLWGGSADQIHQTIVGGRKGYMPAYGTTLNPEQTDEVANYVLSLSGIEHNAEAAAKGQKIFNGYAGGCYQCHATAGKGLYSQGSANLTDQIWTVADTKGDESPEERLKLVKNVIANGIQRQMPVFGTKLSETEVKVLVAYLKQMSGTQQQ